MRSSSAAVLAGSLIAARGGESVFRGSLFRTGYEIFYTPIPSDEKRAAKSIIDVGFDELSMAVHGEPDSAGPAQQPQRLALGRHQQLRQQQHP